MLIFFSVWCQIRGPTVTFLLLCHWWQRLHAFFSIQIVLVRSHFIWSDDSAKINEPEMLPTLGGHSGPIHASFPSYWKIKWPTHLEMPANIHSYTWRNFRIFAKAKIRVRNLFSREILGEISHFIMPIFWFTVLFFERWNEN